MNPKDMTQKLRKLYPNSKIIENKIDNITKEIVCELGISNETNTSTAIVIIEESNPHYHKKTTETYKILEGELRLFVGFDKYILKRGEEIEIKPGQIHYAQGDATWVEVISTPAWDIDDYLEAPVHINSKK